MLSLLRVMVVKQGMKYKRGLWGDLPHLHAELLM